MSTVQLSKEQWLEMVRAWINLKVAYETLLHPEYPGTESQRRQDQQTCDTAFASFENHMERLGQSTKTNADSKAV